MINSLVRLLIILVLMEISGCKKEGPAKPDTAVNTTTIIANQVNFQIVEIDLTKAHLHLFYKKPDGSRFGNFDALAAWLRQSNRSLLFATNGGMFEPDFVPCGLTVDEGKEIVPVNLRDGVGNFYLKPNGIFLIRDGRASIIDSTQYTSTDESISLATQSGPLLVSHGVINSRFNSNSDNRKVRSGVGVRASGEVVFALSASPVTFDEFAKLFRDRLECPDALYLDGVISRFYLPGTDRKASDENFSAMLGVTAP